MALDGKRQIGVLHSLAVVSHADEPAPATVGEHIDAVRAGVECVLDKLLDHTRRALDHLACGNAVDHTLGELADRHKR